MSKVIGFEARGFQIDPTCKGNNIANRMFVTDALGNNVEVYEIGDYASNWTQISYEMPVEKNEDFEFLFAMTGDIDAFNSQNTKCNFIIMPIHEADPDKDWDNRYQYSLMHRDYKPTMEKAWNGSSIRFYRIPFNTGDADRIRFVFVAFQRPYKVFPVKNFEEYKSLEDFNPDGNCGWNKFKNDFKRDFKNDFKNGPGNFGGNNWQNQGWYSGPKDFKEAEKVMSNIGAVVSKAVKEALEGLDKIQKENFGKWQNGPKADNRRNRNYYSSKNSDFDKKPEPDYQDTGTSIGKRKIYADHLNQILKGLDEDDGELDLQGCDIESDKNFIPGNVDDSIVDSITFALDNSSMDGDAFYRIMAKVGDDCTVNANNAVLGASGHGPELAGGFDSRCDDTTFNFVNAQISEAAFISILTKIGDGCNVNLENSDIKDFEEIPDLSGFCSGSFDGIEIRLDNTTISQRFYQALVKCCGDDSKIVGKAVII